MRRIAAATRPSRLINQIALADSRCKESTHELARLIGRSPKILAVIRAQLRKAFAMEPDSLLFTESRPPGIPHKVDSLTDRALSLLALPTVVTNVNQFTALSVRGDPNKQLPYTPQEVLQRVIALRLFERLDHAASRYWNTLVPGSWLTRRERWVELQKALFADRAFMALQLEELTSAGMAMVQALIDAPAAAARERAGGEWASVKVSQLMWPGTPAVAIPGALYLYREGNSSDASHVVYLPGAVRNFYEAASFNALQCDLLALNESLFHELWDCLPISRRKALHRPADISPAAGFICGLEVMDDALEQGAQALLAGQWNNELGCAVKVHFAHVFSDQKPAPQPLNAALFLTHAQCARKQLAGGARLGSMGDHLLRWDQQRRAEEIVFASSAPGLALLTEEQQVKRYEKRLLALLNLDDISAETPAYLEIMSLMGQLSVHAFVLNTAMQNARSRLLELAFWAERPDGAGRARRVNRFMQAQTESLRCEVQLLHRLKLIGTAHRDLVIEVVAQPSATRSADTDTRVLSIAVGSEPDAFYPLHNVWVITTAAAMRVPTRQHPVVLYAFGVEGGVKAFSCVDALTRSLKASLSSLDGSVLWGAVERDKRRDLRAHAARATLAVRYLEIKGKPALAALKKLLGCYHRLETSAEDITRIFSEVKGPELSRALLRGELEEQLKIPVNNALSQAWANVELLRKTVSEAKKLPTWLAYATRAQRKKFMHLQRLYLSSTYAFENRLEYVLPDLYTFARRTLKTRLSQDGISPQWDIDAPFIDMPDGVYGSFCVGSATCTVGDRNIRLTPTAERTTFSLLQLALHNLDPLAPWTKWRLNRARYLKPDWQQRLNAGYLISLVSSLDIGGQYDALINEVFYPRVDAHGRPGEGRIPELLNRALRTGFEHHLFSAAQRGLSATAQRVFNTAMAARTPQDLLKNQHQLQLYVIQLVGHTMLHDRYIAGIVLVHDETSGVCVVYWPEAAQNLILTEYGSLQRAHDELNRIGALPDNAKALARQVAPGWAIDPITHHPDGITFSLLDRLPGFFMVKGVWQGLEFVRSFSIKHLEPTPIPDLIEAQVLEQIACDPQHWLAVVPTSHSHAQALLYRASVLELQRRTQAASDSGKTLQEYRARRLGEQSDATRRRLVGFFSPLYGMFNEAYELLLVARRFHRFGDAHDAVDVGFMSVFLAIDLFSNFIPGPRKAGSAVPRIARPTLSAVLGRIHRLRMAENSGPSRFAPPAVTQLKALERFKVKGVPEGAVALKGASERGVYVKNGECFVEDGTHQFPLYRRGSEQWLRLKNRQSPGQDELILTIHQPREWLLSADAPQPMAGPSSGSLNPWRPPTPPPPDWRPPTVRGATEDAIRQSMTTSDHWLNWRTQPPGTQMSSPAPGIFHNALDARGFPHYLLQMAPPDAGVLDLWSGYYRLLPQGDQAPLDGIVFIHRNEPLVSLATLSLERWASSELHEQPFPVSRNPAGHWQVHKRLFDRPLSQSVGTAFPTLTAKSREFAVARIIELSGPERPATASHMLNVRATLDNWLPAAPARPGQTDDLLKMLRATERGRTSIFISLEDKAPGFTRVDFRIHNLDPALRPRGGRQTEQRGIAMRQAVTRELQQQGFDVQQVQVRRSNVLVHDLIATHPLSSSNEVYYLSTHWTYAGTIRLNTRLTNEWFKKTFIDHPHLLPLASVKRAMRENRLIRIVAGIQWSTEGMSQPSVYFAKVSPS